MAEIKDNIKKRRIELGMTQTELAHKMGYKSKHAISKIETGVNDVGQINIKKFAEVLHTTPAELLGELSKKEEKENDAIVGIIKKLRKSDKLLETVINVCKVDEDDLDFINQVSLRLIK